MIQVDYAAATRGNLAIAQVHPNDGLAEVRQLPGDHEVRA